MSNSSGVTHYLKQRRALRDRYRNAGHARERFVTERYAHVLVDGQHASAMLERIASRRADSMLNWSKELRN